MKQVICWKFIDFSYFLYSCLQLYYFFYFHWHFNAYNEITSSFFSACWSLMLLSKKHRQISLSHSIQENRGLPNSKKVHLFQLWVRFIMADIAQLQFLNLFLKQLAKKLTFIQQFFFQNKFALNYLSLKILFPKLGWGGLKLSKTLRTHIFKTILAYRFRGSNDFIKIIK